MSSEHERGQAVSPSLLVQRLSQGGVVEGFDLSHATLPSMVLAGFTFRDGRFDGANLDDLEMTAAVFDRVSFAADASLRGALFESCIVRQTSFAGADLRGSLFIECTFDCRTTFTDAVLEGATFRNCSFPAAMAGARGGRPNHQATRPHCLHQPRASHHHPHLRPFHL